MKETEIQKLIHRMLSLPQRVAKTKSGRRLQILSPGRINVNEGPDFLDIAILLNGMVVVGDAEFHRRSSEWNCHGHAGDMAYENVILHIVFNDDMPDLEREVLLINENELHEFSGSADTENNGNDLHSAEELQHFALMRLLRKTSDAQKLLNKNPLDDTLKISVAGFLKRYNSRRKRPVYTETRLANLISTLEKSYASDFLKDIQKREEISLLDNIQKLIKSKIGDEGPHLRREIVLNSVLPIALCLADEKSRIELFLWYWSTPALNSYGSLTRRFTDLPQNFLWQQQGMLEYIREQGRRPNVISEAVRDYGFAEVLSFYRLGKAPFRELSSENDEL
ncbi:MAG: DUF2851 family protein [Bacteroidota bacterium]